MRKINFVSDCTCDLTKDLIEKNNIEIMPLYITIGGKVYRDGIDISMEELYNKVDEYRELPKSAAVSIATYMDVFSKYPNDEDIIFIGIGSQFSSSYNSAFIASKEFDNVYVIDSANLSSGIGLLLLKMCKFRDQGMDAKTIKTKIEELVPLVRTQFAINTLEYLHMGGRCSGTSRIFGTLLKMKPIIRVVDGKMTVTKKPIGRFRKALDTLLDYFDCDLTNIDTDNVMVTHSMASEDAKYLIEEINKRDIKINDLHETFASGVISTHCGPRTIGILYILKK